MLVREGGHLHGAPAPRTSANDLPCRNSLCWRWRICSFCSRACQVSRFLPPHLRQRHVSHSVPQLLIHMSILANRCRRVFPRLFRLHVHNSSPKVRPSRRMPRRWRIFFKPSMRVVTRDRCSDPLCERLFPIRIVVILLLLPSVGAYITYLGLHLSA